MKRATSNNRTSARQPLTAEPRQLRASELSQIVGGTETRPDPYRAYNFQVSFGG